MQMSSHILFSRDSDGLASSLNPQWGGESKHHTLEEKYRNPFVRSADKSPDAYQTPRCLAYGYFTREVLTVSSEDVDWNEGEFEF